mmetsp:Transcript_33972/g.95531  ORF Transcript_33972/g.95531 Transcript_33972/m.95531 type:complete len:361 (+) Transcript_33972:707-1789(+)
MSEKTLWMDRRFEWSSWVASDATQSEKNRDMLLKPRMFFMICSETLGSIGVWVRLTCSSHGCLTTAWMSIRSCGFAFRAPRMKSMALSEIASQVSPLIGNCPFFILWSCTFVLLPQKGGLPQSMTYVRTPRLQTSHPAEYCQLLSASRTSGAAYRGVPTVEVMLVSPKNAPSPQSMTLMWSSLGLQKQMFSGLMSRCATSLVWAYFRALATCLMTSAVVASSMRPCSKMRSNTSLPSHSSMTTCTKRPCSYVSYSLHMLGWFSCFMMFTSFWNRACLALSPMSSFLIATFRLHPFSVPTYTFPWPPQPISLLEKSYRFSITLFTHIFVGTLKWEGTLDMSSICAIACAGDRAGWGRAAAP